ncbi:MAG: four helix bundle protein [Gammaproteobacteria bacterium]
MAREGRRHHSLRVWQDAVRLVTTIYRLTENFPPDERYGLVSQMRRSAVSVPSNIAEGAGRGSEKEWLQFLFIARGSMSELETQIMVAENLGYIQSTGRLFEEIDKLFAQLGALINRIKTRIES